jgi:hypothetical protein
LKGDESSPPGVLNLRGTTEIIVKKAKINGWLV